eukprot:TRINITY_DN75285_c0_g1_i1.p1 TRINITY_DN75285_c0_g1~~TRINITY_DN75285_c0_g1_i1.p1  ORF type:complete len:682 (-),score=152.67 TRINITY_DN75285_c0_g1_i1:60-2105(-)
MRQMHRYSGLVQRVEGSAGEKKQKILAIYAKAASLATARTGEDVAADPRTYLGTVGQVVPGKGGKKGKAPNILVPPGAKAQLMAAANAAKGKSGGKDHPNKSAPGAGAAAALAAAEALAASAKAAAAGADAPGQEDKSGKRKKEKEKSKDKEKEREKDKEKTKSKKRKFEEKVDRKEKSRRKESKKAKKVKVKKKKHRRSSSDASAADDSDVNAGADDSSAGKYYVGQFVHPCFGSREIDLIVQLKREAAGSWGQTTASWVIMGQVIDSTVTVTYEGRRVIFSDGTVMLDGTIDEQDVVQGEVVMEGVRGGSFVLNPAEPPALESAIKGMKKDKKANRRSRSSSSESSSSSSAKVAVAPTGSTKALPGISTSYVGHFVHPSFGAQNVTAVVQVERMAEALPSVSTGSWVIMGQLMDSIVKITCEGSRIIFSDGTVVLEGTVQMHSGLVQGDVVIDGQRGGNFVLRPKELSRSGQDVAEDALASPQPSAVASPASPIIRAQPAEAFANTDVGHERDNVRKNSTEALPMLSPREEGKETIATERPSSPWRSPRSPSPQMAQPVGGGDLSDEEDLLPILSARAVASDCASRGASSAFREQAAFPAAPSSPPPKAVGAGCGIVAAVPKARGIPPADTRKDDLQLRKSRNGDMRPMAVKSKPMTRSKAAGPPAARSKANMAKRRRL